MSTTEYSEYANGTQIKLSPCPFCGGRPYLVRSVEDFIICQDCAASTRTMSTPSGAADAWNRREK